ncbi:MAG TPA: hypothetical protein VFO25_08095 [Candidatus Eremiobacteraceae bacterium]|nr:hypothetical protein [Candidatus Eremiobacteraceae bacterium]
MSGLNESLQKIIDAQRIQGQRFHSMQVQMKSVHEAVENSLRQACLQRHPVTNKELVSVTVAPDRDKPTHVLIRAFDGKSIDFRLLPTGKLEVTTPDFSIGIVELRVSGGSAGMTDVDFVTAEERRFGLGDVLSRFFKTVLDDLEDA